MHEAARPKDHGPFGLDEAGTCAESKLSSGRFCVQLTCFWLCECEHVTSHLCPRPASWSIKQQQGLWRSL